MSIQITDVTVPSIHHVHRAGEWMLGYGYRGMSMDGNLDGTKDVSTADVLADYAIAPLSMRSEMHMLHGMYAPTDDWTWSVMLPFVERSMEHRTGMGMEFTTSSKGAGDVRAGGLATLHRGASTLVFADVIVTLPTGSIDERDDTPMGADQKLPYPMQLGSGTFDLKPAVTRIEQREAWTLGVRAQATLRLGRNDEGYSLGDQVGLGAWGTRQLGEHLSASLRLDALAWGDVDGSDGELNPAMVPTADPDLRAGRRVDLLVGLNLFSREGQFSGQRLAIEVGAPIYESFDGPQLGNGWTLMLTWRITR